MTWLFFFVLSRQCCACGSLLNQGYLTHIDDIITSFQVLVSSPLNVGLLSEAEWRDGSGGGDVCADEDGDDQGLTGRHGSFLCQGCHQTDGTSGGMMSVDEEDGDDQWLARNHGNAHARDSTRQMDCTAFTFTEHRSNNTGSYL